jgi:antitoxin component YwqK of YwqJK toxin-antitoxin module
MVNINQRNTEGLREGPWEIYFFNRVISYKGCYINDERDGYWESYRMDGQLDYTGYFKNGKPFGYWVVYEEYKIVKLFYAR